MPGIDGTRSTGCGLGVNGRIRQRGWGDSVDTVLSFENTGRLAESIAHGIVPRPHPCSFACRKAPSPLHPW
jgi:hypothetical protein